MPWRCFFSGWTRCLLLVTIGTSCQRTPIVIDARSHASTTVPKQIAPLDSVLVRGKIFSTRDTLKTSRDLRVEFRRQTDEQGIELVTDNTSQKTGRYQVYLAPGETYYAALIYTVRNCEADAEEVFVAKSQSTQTKNFYLSYPDSTAYGGCLTGFHP
jgi:hypothetical protein